jgi:hypothetical protein
MPDITKSTAIIKRKVVLIYEARILLKVLKDFGKEMSSDPWSDPKVISMAIKNGILDTPHFQGNPKLCGKIRTRIIHGACYAVDEKTGNPIDEEERTDRILMSINNQKDKIWQV